ncbi:MAG: 2'-5' RNA ligase family protein [Anaerolineaceae bacterium]
MFAILSLLDTESEVRVFDLWRTLESTCGFERNHVTTIPHISWQVAESYNVDEVKRVLERLAKASKPFTIQTAGIGMFTGNTPVLYLDVVMNEKLDQFHRYVWQAGVPFAHGISELYQPDAWVPHITLSYGEITPGNIGCALEGLAFQSLRMSIQIQNVALASQEDDLTGKIHQVYPFSV